MKRLTLISFLFFGLAVTGISQDISWNAGLYSFFDNIEFGNSPVKIPQTMSGVQFIPGVVILKDSVHKLNFGINLLHEFGSFKAIDKLYPTAYYEYNKKPFRFLMGAFPRAGILDNYPRMFFQDSVYYYRPNINGILWELYNSGNYLNIWLDWTGRQSETVNEAFFIGVTDRYNIGSFYLRYFGYMFHFAGKKNPVVAEPLHDNLLSLSSVGIDLSGRTLFDRLDVNIGWVTGAERARAANAEWILKSGLLAEVKVEYKFIGIFNSFYKGSPLMSFYHDHGTDLYWGDPAYRTNTYNRSDLYLRLINNDIVNLELTYSFHFLDRRIYQEQLLKVRVNLSGS